MMHDHPLCEKCYKIEALLAEAEALLREALDEADFDHDEIRPKIEDFLRPADSASEDK